MATVAFCLHHSTGQLEAEDAGTHGLDEDLFLWQRYLTLLTNFMHHSISFLIIISSS